MTLCKSSRLLLHIASTAVSLCILSANPSQTLLFVARKRAALSSAFCFLQRLLRFPQRGCTEACPVQSTTMSQHTDTHVTGEAVVNPLSPLPEDLTATSTLLSPANSDTSTETPKKNLQETSSPPDRQGFGVTPSFFSAAYPHHLSKSPSTPVRDSRCECGGISSHHHGQRRDWTAMNGAHPPTGPRGDTTTTQASAKTPTSPSTPSTVTGGAPRRIGPLPNYVQVARAYVFEQAIQNCLRDNGVSQVREDTIRLAGVQWIDNVRRALKL